MIGSKFKIKGKTVTITGQDANGKYIINNAIKMDQAQVIMHMNSAKKSKATKKAEKKRKAKQTPSMHKKPSEVSSAKPEIIKSERRSKKRETKTEEIEKIKKEAESVGVKGGAKVKSSPDKGATDSAVEETKQKKANSTRGTGQKKPRSNPKKRSKPKSGSRSKKQEKREKERIETKRYVNEAYIRSIRSDFKDYRKGFKQRILDETDEDYVRRQDEFIDEFMQSKGFKDRREISDQAARNKEEAKKRQMELDAKIKQAEYEEKMRLKEEEKEERRREKEKKRNKTTTDYKKRGVKRAAKIKNIVAIVDPGKKELYNLNKNSAGPKYVNAFDLGVGGDLWTHKEPTPRQATFAFKVSQKKEKDRPLANFIMNLAKIESMHGKNYVFSFGIDSMPRTETSKSGKTRRVDPMIYGTRHNYDRFPFFKQGLQGFYSKSISGAGRAGQRDIIKKEVKEWDEEQSFISGILNMDYNPPSVLDKKCIAYGIYGYKHLINFIEKNKVRPRMGKMGYDNDYVQPWKKKKGSAVMIDTRSLLNAITMTVKRDKKVIFKIGGRK
jgi:hypothetical protein